MLGEELCKEPPCLAFSSLILSSPLNFAALRCPVLFQRLPEASIWAGLQPMRAFDHLDLVNLVEIFEANKSRTIQTYCTQISDFSNIAPKVSKYSQPTAAQV